MQYLKDLIIIMLICVCATESVQNVVRVQVRRAGTSRITPRMVRQE